MKEVASVSRNKEPIFNILKKYLNDGDRVLEVGSGNAQQLTYFAKLFPAVHWVLSDRKQQFHQIHNWLKSFSFSNLDGPLEYEAGKTSFPQGDFNLCYTSNTIHIMAYDECLSLFNDLTINLNMGSLFVVYGPFNYHGGYTSESNREFDIWLKNQNCKSSIKDFEVVCADLFKCKFNLIKDHEMPANNRLLVFKKF